MPIRKIARYGWRKQAPDPRDHAFKWQAPEHLAEATLPSSASTKQFYPAVFDQGRTGSCTGNSSVAVAMHRRAKAGMSTLMLSRLFAYYNGRVLEGCAGTDAGAELRDVLKGMNTTGICREQVWDFLPGRVTNLPNAEAYKAAAWHKITAYHPVDQKLDTLKACIVADDPPVFGFMVYESFESDAVAQSGVMPMPGPNEGQVGGHAVCLAAYDDDMKAFLVRNSWGAWGLDQSGYFLMPYDFILNPDYASDFATIESMSA